MEPQKFIAGNWKMNKTVKETKLFLEELKAKVKNANCEVAVLVPAIDLQVAVETLKETEIKVGAQNCYFEEKGAFTGEISPVMLRDLGVTYVVVGHSERRSLFYETDDVVNKKIKAVLAQKMSPIFCVGETQEEREAGKEKEIVKKQLETGLIGVTTLQNVVIAYEPVWAIGTGLTATVDQAQEMCEFIRDCLADMFADESVTVTIQYGGSMNGGNAKELLSCKDINGGLIGSASLKVEDFKKIIESC